MSTSSFFNQFVFGLKVFSVGSVKSFSLGRGKMILSEMIAVILALFVFFKGGESGAFWSFSRFILYFRGAGEEREQKEIKGAGMHLTFMLLISQGISYLPRACSPN